ncbi:MAG: BMP family ABC transporter substrate-binding protein, partial [Evtepia sp.]
QKTETNRLGYVAAFPSAQGISAFTAYYLGAKSVNDQVTMVVRYTNAWSDAEQETQLAQGLIDLGCDVLSYTPTSPPPPRPPKPTGSLWWAATRTSPRWPQTPP